MHTIDPRRFGFALGSTWALLYLGCAFLMATLPREKALAFANTLVHGVDWAPIVNWDKSWSATVMGVVCVFVLGWLIGATFAALYNLTARNTPSKNDSASPRAPKP